MTDKPWHQTTGRHDVSNDTYHAAPSVSNSRLSYLARSPMHYRHFMEHGRIATPAMGLGSMVHAMLLEPETVADRFVVPPNRPRRSKADKAAFSQWAAQYLTGDALDAMRLFGDGGLPAADADRILAQHVEIVTPAQLETARDMVMALQQHQAVQFLLSGQHAVESSVVWQDDFEARGRAVNMLPDDVNVSSDPTDLWLRSRPDVLRWHDKNWGRPADGGVIAGDLKTCDNASPNAFARSAYNFRYHVQGALCLDGLDAINEPADHFALVCVESSPPHAVAVYKIDDAAVELGRLEYLRNLTQLAECIRADHWPAYSDGVLDLTLPGWAYAAAYP